MPPRDRAHAPGFWSLVVRRFPYSNTLLRRENHAATGVGSKRALDENTHEPLQANVLEEVKVVKKCAHGGSVRPKVGTCGLTFNKLCKRGVWLLECRGSTEYLPIVCLFTGSMPVRQAEILNEALWVLHRADDRCAFWSSFFVLNKSEEEGYHRGGVQGLGGVATRLLKNAYR